VSAGRVFVLPGSLSGLEAARVDALAVLLGAERAQPRGLAGRVDWRLDGRLARLVRDRRFEGRPGERLLTPGGGGLGPRRIFLFGADQPPTLADRRGAIRALLDAGARTVALSPMADRGPLEEALGWLGGLEGRARPLASVVLFDEGRRLEAAWAQVAAAAARAGLDASAGPEAPALPTAGAAP
jgi:hypothetical protein